MYTDKNKTLYSDDVPDVMPFIPYDFQREYITEVRDSIIESNKPAKDRKPWFLRNVFVEKSRQMGISWVTCYIFVYWFLFHKHKYTMISMTASEVDVWGDTDSLFEKLRFTLRNLPDRMLPKWFPKETGKSWYNSYMRISDPNSTASITGKTGTPDAGRWGTRNAAFMDEMASIQYATQINKSLWSAVPCIIYNSTPKWEWNEFYRIRKRTKDRTENWKFIPADVKGLRYHWKDHPSKTQEWYENEIKGKTREQIAQEYEIDYNTALVWRVYPEFPKEADPNCIHKPELPLYVWMDNNHWWQDPNAIIVMQNDWVYRNLIDCIEIYQPPEFCAEFLVWQPRFNLEYHHEEFLKRFKTYNRKRAIRVSDPFDTDSSMWSTTIKKEYKKVWINLTYPESRDKDEHIRLTTTNMYRIRYWENCDALASAIMNATYPERRETSQSTSENNRPVHNRTSHFRTALEYWVTYMIENPMYEKPKPQGLSQEPAYKMKSRR